MSEQGVVQELTVELGTATANHLCGRLVADAALHDFLEDRLDSLIERGSCRALSVPHAVCYDVDAGLDRECLRRHRIGVQEYRQPVSVGGANYGAHHIERRNRQ